MAENTDREAVSTPEWIAAHRQAVSVRGLPEIESLLARQGEAEVSAFWVDDETGFRCKCRPDFVAPAGDGVILIDLKTCQDASPDEFKRTVWNYRYDIQAAWYSDGYAKASGLPVLGFVFACVEAAFPHVAAAYMLDDRALDKGATEIRELMRLLHRCTTGDSWPGYSNSIQLLSLPAWAK